MKMISKDKLRSLSIKAGALLALIMLMPISSLAEDGVSGGTVESSNIASSSFCTNLNSETSGIGSKLAELSSKLLKTEGDQAGKLSNQANQNDQKIASNRSQSDAARATNFAKLESRATTPTQKQAVDAYETSVKSAIDVRRASYDAARSSFRSSVASLVNDKQTSINAQLSVFKTSTNNAINTAKASCAANPANGKAIREAMQTALKSARTSFQDNRGSDSAIGAQVKVIAQTRNSAFKVADDVFKSSMSAAKTALQAAFTKSK